METTMFKKAFAAFVTCFVLQAVSATAADVPVLIQNKPTAPSVQATPQLRPTTELESLRQEARASASKLRATMTELADFQKSKWIGPRRCNGSLISWDAVFPPPNTSKLIADCAPFACDAGAGVCRASCDRGGSGCTAAAKCVMTDTAGHNGVCVAK
jgi:hypothetical protein